MYVEISCTPLQGADIDSSQCDLPSGRATPVSLARWTVMESSDVAPQSSQGQHRYSVHRLRTQYVLVMCLVSESTHHIRVSRRLPLRVVHADPGRAQG